LRLASSSRTNQTGCASGAVAHHAQDEQVQPHGMKGQQLFPVAGAGGQEHPSLPVRYPRRCSEARVVGFGILGQQLQAVGHHVHARNNPRPLRRSAGIEVGGQGRSLHDRGDLLGVAHPPQQVPDLRFAAQQMGQNPTRRVGEVRLLVLLFGQHRGGDGGSDLGAEDLIRQVPVGAAGVQRIEDQVAALGRIELAHEVHRRIVDDGSVAALLYLPQNLPDGGRLPRPGVAHEQDVTRLQPLRNRVAPATGGAEGWRGVVLGSPERVPSSQLAPLLRDLMYDGESIPRILRLAGLDAYPAPKVLSRHLHSKLRRGPE